MKRCSKSDWREWSEWQASRINTESQWDGRNLDGDVLDALAHWEEWRTEHLRRTQGKRYYYHVSSNLIHEYHDVKLNRNRTVTLQPYEVECEGEPGLYRICVAPSVPHCLSAISVCGRELHVYRTSKPVHAYWPFWVPDSPITREKWLIKPTAFTYQYSFETKGMPEVGNTGCGIGCRQAIPHQKKHLEKLRKWFHSNRFKPFVVDEEIKFDYELDEEDRIVA